MTRRAYGVTGVLSVCVLGLTLQGCSSGNEATAPAGTTQGQASAPAGQPASAGQGVTLEFRSTPDPPLPGDNALEVVVTQPDGSAVTDATVEVVFSMAAMPSMNMPAMRSTAALAHQGAGRYRGSGELSMGGTWTVIVTASRGAEELGHRTFSVVAN